MEYNRNVVYFMISYIFYVKAALLNHMAVNLSGNPSGVFYTCMILGERTARNISRFPISEGFKYFIYAGMQGYGTTLVWKLGHLLRG